MGKRVRGIRERGKRERGKRERETRERGDREGGKSGRNGKKLWERYILYIVVGSSGHI